MFGKPKPKPEYIPAKDIVPIVADGLGRAQAKTAAHDAIALMRKTGEFRIPN